MFFLMVYNIILAAKTSKKTKHYDAKCHHPKPDKPLDESLTVLSILVINSLLLWVT